MTDETLDHPPGRPALRRFPPVRTAVTGVLVLAALVTLVSLGNWQVRRLHWKEGLLAKIAERMHAPAVPLSEVESAYRAGKDIEYRHVKLTGTFDNSKERHFLATYEGASGFFIYTPLTTEAGQVVFVNRGFVPYDRKAQKTRPESLATGIRKITGLARAAPSRKPGSMVPDNDIAKNIFYWKDLKAMASSTGVAGADLVPFFVDADRTPGSRTLPVGGVTFVNLPNNHLQYAITWYGLAVVLVFVTGSAVWRRWTGTGEETGIPEDRP